MSQQFQPPTVGTDGAAKILRCGRKKVLELVRAKKIPGEKIGRGYTFVIEDLTNYISSGQNDPSCQSRNAPTATVSKAKTTTPDSPGQTDAEYFTALEFPKKAKPKNTKTRLEVVSGGKQS